MVQLVTNTLLKLPKKVTIVSKLPLDDNATTTLLQWSTYDDMSHILTLEYSQKPSSRPVLSSSYTIRKALIRKHFLHRTFVNYVAKHPDSILVKAVPRTWSIELAFADELDELWSDELWELGQKLDESPQSTAVNWWILKPGMADRGMGIRLFHDKASLTKIFESFEDPDSDGEDEREERGSEDTGDSDNTGVAMSQLRHFVIQEYLPNPLLVDPSEAKISGAPEAPQAPTGVGRKFHLRAYCAASGALKLYLCPRILALFAPSPYSVPIVCETGPDDDEGRGGHIDLTPHLTNTSLQRDNVDIDGNVRLLDELIGCQVYPSSPDGPKRHLAPEDISNIVNQVAEILTETFQAALAMSVHFQPLPNVFEIFGADLLVTYNNQDDSLQVHILEMNAEPAIELTGKRLQWILDDFFQGVANVCVRPFLFHLDAIEDADETDWTVGETRYGLRKCLDVRVRGPAV
ncbi:hypothetical protein FRB97_000431 [Tulasnella sp. 331]|nr:hypothetical protein FRB97_000431 [Tulasnella sp. 331]